VTLAISGVCNSNCLMCSCHSPLLEPKGVAAEPYMEPRIFESIVRECRAMGTFRIALCGDGEPTLHPQFDDVLKLMARLGVEPYVIANGLALDDTRLELWASLRGRKPAAFAPTSANTSATACGLIRARWTRLACTRESSATSAGDTPTLTGTAP
jgi:organic radical activating enzyme